MALERCDGSLSNCFEVSVSLEASVNYTTVFFVQATTRVLQQFILHSVRSSGTIVLEGLSGDRYFCVGVIGVLSGRGGPMNASRGGSFWPSVNCCSK